MLYLSSLGLAALTATIALTGSTYLPSQQATAAASVHHHGDHHHQSGDHFESPGKPGTNIVHLTTSQFEGLIGETLELPLALQSPLHEGELRVEFNADPELVMTVSDTSWQFALDQSIPEIPIAVTASEPGAHHVHLTVQHWLDGEVTHARALAVEVTFKAHMATKLYEKSYKVTEAPTVISLPAVETIR